jgi:hypothetical protein
MLSLPTAAGDNFNIAGCDMRRALLRPYLHGPQCMNSRSDFAKVVDPRPCRRSNAMAWEAAYVTKQAYSTKQKG